MRAWGGPESRLRLSGLGSGNIKKGNESGKGWEKMGNMQSEVDEEANIAARSKVFVLRNDIKPLGGWNICFISSAHANNVAQWEGMHNMR